MKNCTTVLIQIILGFYFRHSYFIMLKRLFMYKHQSLHLIQKQLKQSIVENVCDNRKININMHHKWMAENAIALELTSKKKINLIKRLTLMSEATSKKKILI